MKADTYTMQGKKSGTVELPENLFGVTWNEALMHQVVTSMLGNARTPVAHTKTRGEVRGGGKKPWQQKGTGRARHGSIRSPIWKGGGVTHGPRNDKSYSRTIPKKMRAKALFMALSRKFKDGEIVFLDTLAIDEPKTALAKKTLVTLAGALSMPKLATKTKNTALIALADPKNSVIKSFQNMANVECKSVRELNPVSVLKYSYVIIENPDAAVAVLAHRAGAPKKEVAPKKTKTLSALEKQRALEKGDQ